MHSVCVFFADLIVLVAILAAVAAIVMGIVSLIASLINDWAETLTIAGMVIGSTVVMLGVIWGFAALFDCAWGAHHG